MAGFNKIFLMGNLTRDPQLSYTPSQTAVVDFGLATNRKWTSQDGSQRQDQPGRKASQEAEGDGQQLPNDSRHRATLFFTLPHRSHLLQPR